VNKIDKNKYLNLSQLKARGWTSSKVCEWLREPDEYTRNPMYKSASPTKLYLLKRVTKQEKNKRFIEWFKDSKEKRIKLSQKQKSIHELKKQELLSYINSLEINIPKMDKKRLYFSAVEHYNYLWESRGKYEKKIFCDACDEEFLNRISMNMLRHESEKYEEEIYKMFDKTGKDDAYSLLKNRVNKKILDQYPFLESIV